MSLSAEPRHTTHSHRLPARAAERGLTLVELMITLAVLAILAGIAAPSFREQSARARLDAQAGELMATLQLARSEAIRRNSGVRFCVEAGSWRLTDHAAAASAAPLREGLVVASVKVQDACADFRGNGLAHECDCNQPTPGNVVAHRVFSFTTPGQPTRTLTVSGGTVRVQ